MKIIIVDQKHGETRSIVLKGWTRVFLTFCLLGFPVVLGFGGYQISAARNADLYDASTARAWADKLSEQEAQILQARQETAAQLQALTARVANLQARLLRLDALGERLTSISELDDGEFSFTEEPGLGGPEMLYPDEFAVTTSYQSFDLLRTLDELGAQIEDRQQQLEVLNSLLSERQTLSTTIPSGRPVTQGWLSSSFGRRIDPFSGNYSWHGGVDFATGEAGIEVAAVGAGVVTFAGERGAYGKLVEINHGNGYRTLYAHHQEILVNAGDIVKRGQVIALSGSTGRSTGPHVHFEIHKNGRVIDPASYIRRTNR